MLDRAQSRPVTRARVSPAGKRPAAGGRAATVLALQGLVGNRALAGRLGAGARLQRAFDATPSDCGLPGVTGKVAANDAKSVATLEGNAYFEDEAWAAGSVFYVPIVADVNEPEDAPAEARWAQVRADDGVTGAILDDAGAVLLDDTFFSSEADMMACIERLIPAITAEQSEKFVFLKEKLLDDYEYQSGLSVFESLDFYKREIAALDHQPMPVTGGGAKGKAWKSGATSAAAKRIVETNKASGIFPGGQHSVHHKLSQSKIKTLMDAVEADEAAARPVTDVIDTLMARSGGGNRRKALLNLPPNLEVGPPSDQRLKDPGSGVDLNETASGTVTPRSEALNDVDQLISAQPIDFAAVAKKLQAVLDAQDQLVTRSDLLTPPLVHQWTKGKGNKYERNA